MLYTVNLPDHKHDFSDLVGKQHGTTCSRPAVHDMTKGGSLLHLNKAVSYLAKIIIIHYIFNSVTSTSPEFRHNLQGLRYYVHSPPNKKKTWLHIYSNLKSIPKGWSGKRVAQNSLPTSGSRMQSTPHTNQVSQIKAGPQTWTPTHVKWSNIKIHWDYIKTPPSLIGTS